MLCVYGWKPVMTPNSKPTPIRYLYKAQKQMRLMITLGGVTLKEMLIIQFRN